MVEQIHRRDGRSTERWSIGAAQITHVPRRANATNPKDVEAAMDAPLKNSDICLSIRSIGGNFSTAEEALRLLQQLAPTRIEWSYIRDGELIERFKEVAPVFVAALNTIAPPGRAKSFIGAPIIAPWMARFGKPGLRSTYICQNNPEDLEVRIEQAVGLIAEGVTGSFQFDDWFCNGQMINFFGNPCFCEHCMREFAVELGLDVNYLHFLRGRGFTHADQIVNASKDGQVPLWEDYRRFQLGSVTRFFRRLRAAMDQALAAPASLSVNGSVCSSGGRTETVAPFVSYLNGETHDFRPAALLEMAQASRSSGIKQIVSFCPDVPADEYDDDAFVRRVNQAIALCYCLGLVPLFPYDVYAGNDATGAVKPRWFGTWKQFHAPYEIARSHPDWLDDYAYASCDIAADGGATIQSLHRLETGRTLQHTIAPDGTWETAAANAGR
jgi:hypothetical protein